MIIHNDRIKATSVSFFIADFSLLNCDLIALYSNYSIESFYTRLKLILQCILQNIYNTFTVPCKKV